MLEMADEDWGMAREMLSGRFPDRGFGFHVQQAAEKALKAWLSLRGVRYPRVHALDSLLDEIAEGGEEVQRFRGLTWLTKFAQEFRYDGLPAGHASVDRQTILTEVAALLAHVRQLLETELEQAT
jgi:HEPN domain-containing protein